MNRMKHLFCVLLLATLGSFSFKANAYTERNMLQKAADETTLKNVLVMKQAWVPYPAYTDRAAWDFDEILISNASSKPVKNSSTINGN